MIRYVVALIIVAVFAVLGLSIFLQPNDITKCGKSPSDKQGCSPVDAIVAVSGGDTSARVNWAVNLYKMGWAKTIIFSGAALDSSGPSNAEAMKRSAIDMGVSKNSILVDETSATTKQNAQNVSLIIKDHDYKSIILVTSGYHQKRAYLEFSKYNPGILIKNSPALIDRDWSPSWWTSVNGWWFAVGEFIKIIGFYLFGF